MRLYSLLDKKANVFGAVMMAFNDGHMSRFIGERFGGGEDTVGKYPEDFDLYDVGSFDENGGVIEQESVRFVVNLSVIMRRPDA